MKGAAEAAGQKYVVEKNDSLVSISIRFNTTVQRLCEVNNLSSEFIFTGQELTISPPDPIDQAEIATDISLQNTSSDSTEIEVVGTLTCKSGLLSFIPDDTSRPTLTIDLVAHLQSAFVDHSEIKNEFETPDKTVPYSLLVVTYLRDKNDAFTLSTASFSGKKDSLTPIYKLMKEQAKIVQERDNFIVPMMPPKFRTSDMEPTNPPPPKQKKRKESPKLPLPQEDLSIAEPKPKKTRKKRALRPIEMEGTTRILKPDDILSIRELLPYHLKMHKWKLLYQLSSHGSSYLSFFEKCQNASPVVFAISTDTGERIGAYISSGFRVSRNFYGSGDTFVFKLQPHFQGYKWENSNKYFVATSKDEIAIGGGGASALWVDGNFLNAFSEPCPTFGSPGLTSTPHFKILDVEVWNIADF